MKALWLGSTIMYGKGGQPPGCDVHVPTVGLMELWFGPAMTAGLGL